MATDKRCGTCRFYAKFGEADPEYGISEWGHCAWSSERLPWSLRWADRERVSVHPSEGESCPAWEALAAKEGQPKG